jgi:uncharacterized protein YPO0396
MANDPRGHVSTGDAPRLLIHTPHGGPPLPPMRASDEVRALHVQWARAHGAAASHGARWRGRLWALTRRIARRIVRRPAQGQEGDHELIGRLINAVDSLAARCDELTARLSTLDDALAEFVTVTSEDLTRIAARHAPGTGAD